MTSSEAAAIAHERFGTVHETAINGIRTLWATGPEPFTAALVFGVGIRDETFRTRGVTHAIEHLAMSTLPKSHLDCNAEVTPDRTMFYATGRREEVFTFLARIGVALRGIPLDRLARETGVLEAEGEEIGSGCALALTHRFGFRGLGLAGTSGPGVATLDATMVQQHAEAFFTSENAALVMTGEPPVGLELTLPSGGIGCRPSVAPLSLRTPGLVWEEEADTPPVLSFLLPSDVTLPSVLVDLIAERATDELRHRLGVAYEVDPESYWFDGGSVHTLVCSTTPERAGQAVSVLWQILNDIARNGPTNEELQFLIDGHHAMAEDPRSLLGFLFRETDRILEGQRRSGSLDAYLAELAEVTPGELQQLATDACRTALFIVPEDDDNTFGIPSGLADLSDLPPQFPRLDGDGETFGRKLISLAPRGFQVVRGRDGLTVRAGGEVLAATRWEDVVGLGQAPGERELVLASGDLIVVPSGWLAKGDQLFAELDRRLADVAFPRPEE